MIALLRGRLAGRSSSWCVLVVGGVGYGVWAPERCILEAAGADGETTLYTHMSVRQDAIELFGFSTPQDREFFRMLLGISGIGPKAALNILSSLDAASLARAITQGDDKRLVAVPGVGKKTAARLILELKEKVKALASTSGAADDEGDDVLDVLENLGCDPGKARAELDQVRGADPAPQGVDALLAECLQRLGREGRG